MTRADWRRPDLQVLGLFLNGREVPDHGQPGEPVVDDSFLVLFNAHPEEATFVLPPRRFGTLWQVELSTAEPEADAGSCPLSAHEEVPLPGRSTLLLRRVR